MANLDTNTAILIAVITAFSVVVGGLITSGFNYLIEWQKSKREALKARLDRETREIELRNQAYIKFLSINENQVYEERENGSLEFNRGLVEENVAFIITHASPKVTKLLVDAYPFRNWRRFEEAKKAVMLELVEEKGGNGQSADSVTETDKQTKADV